MRPSDTDPGQKMTMPPEDLNRDARESEPPMQDRWSGAEANSQQIKGRFVDDPEGAVAAAEELVRLTVEDRIRD